MSSRMLNLAPLEGTVNRLREGWARYQQDIFDMQIRDGLVHRFEIAYDVSLKILRRVLEVTSANPSELTAMSFQEQIRRGNECGLLRGDWSAWRNYRIMRARTGQAYAEEVALQVVSGVPDFIEEASCLWQRLSDANT